MMRSRFDRQLGILHDALITMAEQCERAIVSAVRALSRRDLDLARAVRDGDETINQQEREIEGMCLNLLLRQQPVAGDLRAVSTALRMITDLERIGDQAADIAEIILEADGPDVTRFPSILQMASACVDMVTTSVTSFTRRDLAMARGVCAADDTVDLLFAQIRQELTAFIQKHGNGAGFALDLLMIAKYLERIGDHAVNVAEWAAYSITGIHEGAN